MHKSLVRKGLVLGIIVLFVGASVISTNAGVAKNSIKQTDTQIESEEYPNFVGTIYITWNNLYTEPLKNFRPNVTIVPVPIEERHYNFPADENNMVRFNFSAKLVVEQIKPLTLPRLTFAGWGHGKDSDPWHAESLFPPIIVWLNNHINPKTYDIYWEDELERNTNGAENMTLFVHLEGYGFPFGFLLPPGIIYEDINVTAHFTYTT